MCRRYSGLEKKEWINVVQDWPAYLLMGAFIWFLLYIFISSRRNKNKDRDR